MTTRALPRTLALGAFEYARLSFDIGTHLSCGSYSHGAYTYIAISSLTYGPLNEPPVAIAGPPQSVYAGARVQLDATGSTDDGPAGALLCSWRVIEPDGTGFGLAGVAPTFVAQQRGTYSIELVATDAQGAASPPSTTTVLATEPAEYAAAQVRVVLALLAAAPRAVFTSRADRQSLLRALEHVLARLERGRRIGEASRDLARALLRSDGCVERGAPDRSRRRSGEVPDFIDDCALQRLVYSALSTARLALSTLAGP